jgi:crotonobetainyl-CoA:carnitine CoA-transferase CaiB-like acyl-CoA transferase
MESVHEALAGLKVVDLGRGMGAAISAKLLAELGAQVRRFEPDSGDPFYNLYDAYPIWHRGARIEKVPSTDDATIEAALADADLCLVGGEDYPNFAWGFDADALSDRHERLVVMQLEGYPCDGIAAHRPAVELLVQARSGLTFEQFSGRPVHLPFSPGQYGAAIYGLDGALAALCRRERNGKGGVVRSSLYEGMLTLGSQYWLEATEASGAFYFSLPKDPHPLVFQCKDGQYIHLVLGSFGSKGRLYRILGIDDPSVGPDDSGLPTGIGDPKNFYGDVDLLAEYVAKFDSGELMPQIVEAGIAANFVLAPGECWDDPQVEHIGILEEAGDGSIFVGQPIHGGFTDAGSAQALAFEAEEGERPLAGVKIVDFGIFVAGPYSGVVLADLGADVIKVETIQGDPNRNIYRSYAAANRGKRTIAVDMKTPEGREIKDRLCKQAHVLLNNFRPGVSARLGVDPASQHAIDPAKIVVEATGYGRGGPSGDRPGFDMIFQACCGHEVRAGGAGNAPMWERSAMVDYWLGALNGLAVLVALYRRAQGKGGADLILSLLDSGLFLFSDIVRRADGALAGAVTLNGEQTGYHAAEAIYAVEDGWIAVAARGDAMRERLAGLAGFENRPGEAWGEAEGQALAALFGGKSLAEAKALLAEHDIWHENCLIDGEKTLEWGDEIASNIVTEYTHRDYGRVKQISSLLRIGNSRPVAKHGVGAPGENTREVLGELGYSVDEIDSFYEKGVVR